MSPEATALQHRLRTLAERLRVAEVQATIPALQEASASPTFWEDQQQAAQIMAELTEASALVTQIADLEDMITLTDELDPAGLGAIDAEIRTLELRALLSREHDAASALLTIHAGTGGVDAQDWAEMLMRMYLRYAEQGATEAPEQRILGLDRSRWKVEVIELLRAEEAGIKKVVLEVTGRFAYGLLQREAGVHRLVRLSPFNAKNLRQTSFALIEVLPVTDQVGGVVVKDDDLRIDVFRAGGHGGQGVNTTDSAVRITHLPTGIVVSVQNERSQHQNKATAMKILMAKLAKLQELQVAEDIAMLKGEVKEGSWGNQIRSYVLQPYQMVKDHRTSHETGDVQTVLDGQVGQFILASLTQPIESPNE